MNFLITMILTIFIAGAAFASDIALISRGADDRFHLVEKIKTQGDSTLFRELIHPSRVGVTVLNENGEVDLGLHTVISSQMVPSVKGNLLDKNNLELGVGSIVETRIYRGKRSRMMKVQVLMNFDNNSVLVSTDKEFAKLVEKYNLPLAIELKGYSSLKVVKAGNTSVQVVDI